ncbi:MAG: NAD(P)H-dependent oxidoreductase [Dehalococcoidia bacterium]|jgi:putative NADPH-quinone reductase
MKILVILGHPDEQSFNHAVAETVVTTLRTSGHQIVFHDLYREEFPPVLPSDEIPQPAYLSPLISGHVNDLVSADGIIVVHPNWWGQPPAILKGWIDRVIRPGAAYEFNEGDSGEGVPNGLLKAGTAIVFTTSNTPESREQAVFGDPLETIWRNCVFGLCGVDNYYRKNFGVIATSTPTQRKEWLEEVRDITNKYFPK